MLLNQYERSEQEYKTWREKQKQSRDDCQPLRTVRGSGLAINIGSATFRGPEERTPRGGTGAQSISAGGAHSAIVLANGELYTWGAGKCIAFLFFFSFFILVFSFISPIIYFCQI